MGGGCSGNGEGECRAEDSELTVVSGGHNRSGFLAQERVRERERETRETRGKVGKENERISAKLLRVPGKQTPSSSW